MKSKRPPPGCDSEASPARQMTAEERGKFIPTSHAYPTAGEAVGGFFGWFTAFVAVFLAVMAFVGGLAWLGLRLTGRA